MKQSDDTAGHGPAMSGDELTVGLKELAEDFSDKAVPSHGKFVHESDKH